MRSPPSRARTPGPATVRGGGERCTRARLDTTRGGCAGLPGPRGLPAPRRRRRGSRATVRHAAGPPAGERPGRARLPRASAQLAPGAGKSAGRERKAPPPGRAGPAGLRGTRGNGRPRRPGRVPAARGAPSPPLLRNFFFSVRPTRKVRPGRGRRAGRAPGGGGRGGSGARGSAAGRRKCPAAGPRPPLGPPGPPPRGDFGGPSPARRCRRRRQMWPGCPEEPTMRGRQNKRVPLLLLSRPSLALPGRRAGSTAGRGRSPGGPWPRAPRFPRGPPPPLRRRKAPRARTPGPGGSGHIVPAARRALGLGRGRSPCAHPPASGSRSRGRLGDGRRDAAAAATLRTPRRSGFRVFFPLSQS